MLETVDVAYNSDRGFDEARRYHEQAVFNHGWDQLVTVDGVLHLPNDIYARLAALSAISQDWDTRQRQERQHARTDPRVDDESKLLERETIAEATNQLGMVERAPVNSRPTFLLAYGANGDTNRRRVEHALDVVEDFDHLVCVASGRPVSDTEREAIQRGLGMQEPLMAMDEAGLMRAVIEHQSNSRLISYFRAVEGDVIYEAHEYEFMWHGQIKRATVLSTPPDLREGDDARRATTIDNLTMFADYADLANHPDATVLAVTNRQYVPSTHAAAVQHVTLPYGVQVETIGYSGKKLLPSELRMEAKAANDANVRLYFALEAAERRKHEAEYGTHV